MWALCPVPAVEGSIGTELASNEAEQLAFEKEACAMTNLDLETKAATTEEPVVKPMSAGAKPGDKEQPTSAGATPDDKELVRACQAGDMKAFETLVTRYQKKVYWIAYNF